VRKTNATQRYLTLDDDLIHKARVLAARRNRSVSALLRQPLPA